MKFLGSVLAFACAAASAAPGDLDPQFGTTGKVVVDVGGDTDGARGIAVDSNDNIILVGRSAWDFAIVKIDNTGKLVPNFGIGGKKNIPVDGGYGGNAVAVDGSGNIFIAGQGRIGDISGFAVLKLDSNGNPATDFGSAGIAIVDVGRGGANDIKLDADGNIYLAGSAVGNFAVAKLNAKGKPITAFGIGGVRAIQLPPNTSIPTLNTGSSVSALALDSNGNIYLIGSNISDFGNHITKRNSVLAKLDANGNLVSSFGESGTKSFDYEFSLGKVIAVDALGFVYLPGIKLDPTGQIISSYSTAAAAVGGALVIPNAIALDGNTNAYIAGWCAYCGTPSSFEISEFAIRKHGANGDVDSSFGPGGRRAYDIESIRIPSNATGIALDSQRRIIVSGKSGPESPDGPQYMKFAVMRLQNVPPSSPVFRFYDQTGNEHFFTISVAERDIVQNAMPQYRYEGLAFNAFDVPASGTTPVYRFLNALNARHFYTASETEKNKLITSSAPYVFEGVAYHAYPSQVAGTSPVYRFFDALTGSHFYTISDAERDIVQSAAPRYVYEGIAFFAIP